MKSKSNYGRGQFGAQQVRGNGKIEKNVNVSLSRFLGLRQCIEGHSKERKTVQSRPSGFFFRTRPRGGVKLPALNASFDPLTLPASLRPRKAPPPAAPARQGPAKRRPSLARRAAGEERAVKNP